ncbi:Guanine nucleotide exchange factor subunit Rich, partial [Schistosoma japonicum]
MYYFVGWPSVLESYCKLDEIFAVCSSEDGETFIVCTSTDVVVFHIKFLCAIGHFSRSNTCLKENGLTSSAILRWDSSRILLCTEKGIVFIYAVEDLQFLYESLDSDSVPSPSMEIFSLIHTIRVSDCKCSVFSLGEFVVVASEKGDLIRIRWDGSYYGESVNLKSISSLRGDRNSEVQVYCKAIEWAPTFGGAFALFSSGHIALFVSFGSGENQTCIEKVLIENVGHPTCTAVNNRFRVLAVGTESSEVLLYKMDDTSGAIQIQHTLRISGRESSYATQNVGSVSEIIWSPDGYTLAVAWMQSGWSLWSVFGALLYTSLNEHVSQFSEMRISNMSWAYHGYNIVGLVTSNNLTGIAKVASTDSVEEEFTSKYASKVEGSLLFSDRLDYPAQKTSYLVVFHLARSSISANPTSDNHLHIVLQTADRIILVNRDQLTSRIQTQNITVPKPYINSNWPVRYVAVSTDGKRIAVSGRNGFIHYNCVSQRWHVFGNIKQENSLHVFGGLVWWKQYICLTCFTENYGSSEVRVYSSNHKLDNQFCSVRNLPLLTLPVIVDNFENLFLTLTNDGCLQIFSLSESLSSKSSVIISPFWTINLTNIVVFPACVVRICLTTLKGNVSVNHTTTSAGSYSSNNFDPGLYSIESLILNYSGDVFMLQRSAVNASPSNDSETSVQSSLQSLSFGTPVLVASEVEILWSTSCSTSFPSQVSNHHLPSPNGIDINVYAKDSLWLYSGAAGLSVWLPLPRVPNSLAFNFNYGSIRSDTSHKVSRDHVSSPVSNFDHRRIMLSFELGGDFYPLSICFGDDLLVGILNEFHYSWNKSIVHGRENTSSDVFELFPYGTLLIKIQVALHQIIRQLLKKNLGIHAYQMGLAYQHLPYFPRTLELLLYEVLEVEAASKVPTPDPLLPQVVSFIQEFPNSLEILANCSRKTDVTWWPHLFMTVGRKPKDLFELCLENNKLETAASYLILLQTSEPLTVSCECALTLFQASLQSLKWDLIRDLLRFLCAIDPTEYNSVDEHKTKKHCNKSNILHLSPYNHTNDLPNPDNDHLQSKITSEKSIHKIVWYGEMSKYRPTRVTLKLLDFASDQLEDFSGTIKVTSDSLMIDSPKSSSDLRTQLGQLLTKVAVDYFRQGYLKRASQLITNIPEIFNDGHLSCHTNALQTWLNKNV